MSSEAKGGLEDVVVSTSDICFIDGREGRLVYRGYDVNDLVEHSSFEEVVYLLWHGSLPTRKELDVHVKALSATATRKLPPGLIALLRALRSEERRVGKEGRSVWALEIERRSGDQQLES